MVRMPRSEEGRKAHNKYRREWEKAHSRKILISLNVNTDADIISRLDAAPSKQGYVKEAVREKMSREAPEGAEKPQGGANRGKAGK